jgi:hypothetical protein
MSILSVEIPREVVGYYQHAAGDIDTAHLLTAGSSITVNIGDNKAQEIRAIGAVANAILNVHSFR